MTDSKGAGAPPQPLAPSTPADRFPSLTKLGQELGVDPHRLRMALIIACSTLDEYEDAAARRAWNAQGRG